MIRYITLTLLCAFTVIGCGGGSGGGSAQNTPSASIVESEVQASRFLARASFGGSITEIQGLVGSDAAEWLAQEFNKPATLYLDRLLLTRANDGTFPSRARSDMHWQAMIGADDQLRQRMVFALSQIMVVSENGFSGRSDSFAAYMDVLSRNAFGNYRTLLEEVTYSPIMAEFLTYLRNRKGDPRTGRMPDENYARELLQLFTIGLIELNPDGTPRLGPDQQPIETFGNDDILGLAKVFTGLSYGGGQTFFQSPGVDDRYRPLIVFPEQHSELEKSFLGVTVPAGTSGEQTIDIALDTIFQHPNVAPFVARQLIQRFTASSPDAAYVGRVAAAFEAGEYIAGNGRRFGNGARGDLQATLAAILLDASLYAESGGQNNSTTKVREPVLRFVHWARAFNIDAADVPNESWLSNTSDPATRLGQQPFRSPSVFNFYRPGFVAPGTETGRNGLTAPELQIIDTTSLVGYVNFMTDYVFDRTPSGNTVSFVPDYSAELALADNPQALVDRLDLLLGAGRMTDTVKSQIVFALENTPIREGSEADDRLRRVRVAVLMAVTSPAYMVIN